MDTLSPEQRSLLMSRVASRDTKPERLVRSAAHRMGFRFRLHRRDLPGTPDLVFPRHRKIIFVHGCFWHQHSCPRGARPSSNTSFWADKLDRNVARDRRAVRRLRSAGWEVLVLWECQTRDTSAMTRRLRRFLSAPPAADR